MTTEVAPAFLLIGDEVDHNDDASTVEALTVPAGHYVLEVTLRISEAFDGSTPTLNVGDGADADGWVDEDDVTEGTPGVYRGTSENTGSYSNTGKLYTTADTIDVTVLSGGGMTQGKCRPVALVALTDGLLD